MNTKKIAGLLALILLSGCAEIKEFPKDFKRDFIGNYRSCTNYNLSYYYARTKE
jgi:hypothetical protein